MVTLKQIGGSNRRIDNDQYQSSSMGKPLNPADQHRGLPSASNAPRGTELSPEHDGARHTVIEEIVPDRRAGTRASNPFTGTVIEAIENNFLANGYRMLLGLTHSDRKTAHSYLAFSQGAVDGILYLTRLARA